MSSSLEREWGVADLGRALLTRVLRSCRAEAEEDAVVLETSAAGLVDGGGAARADRRAGEGIALPKSNGWLARALGGRSLLQPQVAVKF